MKRIADLLLVLLFAAALFVIAGYTVLGPRETVSFYEQRTLQPLPDPAPEALWSGQFFTDLEASYADHLALRTTMLKLHTKTELTMGKVTVNGVAVGSEVLLDYNGYARWGLSSLPDDAERIAAGYAALNRRVQAYGGTFCYLGLPLQSSYFAGAYPDCLDDRQWQMSAVREAFGDAMASQDVPFLDMYSQYAAQGFPKEFYYETDHHFTMRGAFAACQAVLEYVNRESGLSLAVPGEEDFQWTVLPNSFLGSANRKLYGLWETSDVLEIAEGKEAVPFRRFDNGQPVEAAVYALPETPWAAATYGVYMGGDIGESILQTDRPDLPSLLIYGDSFTDPLECLLWRCFDETRSLDLRYYNEKTLGEYLDAYQPDLVLCVRDETVYLSADGNGAVD